MAYVKKEKPSGLEDNTLLKEPVTEETPKEEVELNPLRPDVIVVRFIERYRGITADKEGDFYGGMGSRSEWPLYVPTKRGSSELMNPLTKDEKAYFEKVLGRDLSVYGKHGEPSYWHTGAEGAWNCVVLKKGGLVLRLDNIRDYFYYKILLLHKEIVAGSLEELENNPRATQLFYMSSEKAEIENKSKKANMKYETFMKYGKYQNDEEVLRYIIFMMDNRHESRLVSLDMLQLKVTNYIDNDLKRVKGYFDDPMLETKALLVAAARIKEVLYDQNTGFFYTKEEHLKMCFDGEEPRLGNAAKWLNEPENHDLYMKIQRKLRK